MHTNFGSLINNFKVNENSFIKQSNNKQYQNKSADIPNSNSTNFIQIPESNNIQNSLPILSKGKIQVQLRWMKLNRWVNLEKDYENAFPKISELLFNGSDRKRYDIEPPPNDKKKRRDEMVNLSERLRLGRNKIELIQYPHHSDQVSYIWALFVVKSFTISDIISFASNTSKNSIKTWFEFIKRKVRPNEEEQHKDENDIIFENKVDFTLKWPISLTNIKMPARGNFWDHVQCFDLTNFYTINQKNGNYKWPICSKRIISAYVDSFQEWLINSKLKNCESKIEIDDQFKLKIVDTEEIIDISQDLLEITASSESPKKTGKTILDPREVMNSVKITAAEPISTESNKEDKSDKTPYKSISKEESSYSYRKSRRYDYSDGDDRRRYKDRKRTNRKRRYYRDSSSDFSKSQSPEESDYNYKDRKSRNSKNKRKEAQRNRKENNSSGNENSNLEKSSENTQDTLEMIYKRFMQQKTHYCELDAWEQSA